MEEGLADIEVVDTTGQRVEANNDVHVVLADCIVGNDLEPLLLVTRVQLGARDLDPSGVGGRDTEGVNTNTGELIDGGGVQERGVASLENGTTLRPKSLAQSPLIGSAVTADLGPPDGVVSSLLLQPSTEVGTVGLEGLPVDVVAAVDTEGPGNVVAEHVGRDRDRSVDGEGALLLVVDGSTVDVGVGLQLDAQGVEKGVQVVGE